MHDARIINYALAASRALYEDPRSWRDFVPSLNGRTLAQRLATRRQAVANVTLAAVLAEAQLAEALPDVPRAELMRAIVAELGGMHFDGQEFVAYGPGENARTSPHISPEMVRNYVNDLAGALSARVRCAYAAAADVAGKLAA
jgi:hypothetical protein